MIFVNKLSFWMAAILAKVLTSPRVLSLLNSWVDRRNFTSSPPQHRTWTSRFIRPLSAILLKPLNFKPTQKEISSSQYFGWLNLSSSWLIPFAPSPLQRLQHYYELVRHCAPHWYSHAYGTSTCVSPLTSERQLPPFHTKAWIRVMPSLCRTPPRQ